MRLLFCKNRSFTSRFLMWLFKEKCSQFAIEFSDGVFMSGLSGMRYQEAADFYTKNEVVHAIDLELNSTQEAEMHAIFSRYLPLKKNTEIVLGLLFKKYKSYYLCTGIFKILPTWLICMGVRQRNYGLITAQRLYDLILEHIRNDTVKIKMIF